MYMLYFYNLCSLHSELDRADMPSLVQVELLHTRLLFRVLIWLTNVYAFLLYIFHLFRKISVYALLGDFFLIFYRSNIDGKNDIDITEFKVRY